jgi:hypothetical protein
MERSLLEQQRREFERLSEQHRSQAAVFELDCVKTKDQLSELERAIQSRQAALDQV